MYKKAQGLPITTIVIAVLALLVLVVIGAIFGGQIFKFGIGASTCQQTCIVAPDTPETRVDDSKFDVKKQADCDPGDKPLPGRFVARFKPNADPKIDKPVTCSACCAYGG